MIGRWSTGQRLSWSLRRSPRHAAATLVTLLDDERHPISYVERLYTDVLSERQRTCLRDATLICIEQRTVGMPRMASLTTLAASLGVLSIGGRYAESRLWAVAHRLRDDDADSAGLVVALMANDGPLRETDHWTTIRRTFGPVVALGCLEGVLRMGSERALAWVDALPDAAERSLLISSKLPYMLRYDADGVATYLRSASPRLAGELREWAEELELDVDLQPPATIVDAEEQYPASELLGDLADRVVGLEAATWRHTALGSSAFGELLEKIDDMDSRSADTGRAVLASLGDAA